MIVPGALLGGSSAHGLRSDSLGFLSSILAASAECIKVPVGILRRGSAESAVPFTASFLC